MAHTIFLVHGMGMFGEGWANSYSELLKTLWATYGKLNKAFPIAATARFVPITYGHVFEDWRTRLGGHNEDVIKHIASLPGGMPFDKLADLTSKLTGSSFGATHILDVALFYSSPLFRSAVLSSVDAQIRAALPSVNELQTFSVIAHSLGTAVIQQALQARADEERANGIRPPLFRVRSLLMLANVSRILEKSGTSDVYESIVRPASSPDKGLCDIYLNGRNRLDPIWRPKEFDPVGRWTWESSPNVQRFRHLSFTHLVQPNPHDLGDYLAHPLIHGNFFRSITSKLAIPEGELNERVYDHELKMTKNLIEIASQLSDLEYKNTLESLLELIVKIDHITGPK